MEDLPAIEEDMPPSEVDRVSTLHQLYTQEVENEAEAPTRTYSRRWKASSRSLESREHESMKSNKAFIAVQGEQEETQYYEAMHQDDYKIQDYMQDPMDHLDSLDPDTM